MSLAAPPALSSRDLLSQRKGVLCWPTLWMAVMKRAVKNQPITLLLAKPLKGKLASLLFPAEFYSNSCKSPGRLYNDNYLAASMAEPILCQEALLIILYKHVKPQIHWNTGPGLVFHNSKILKTCNLGTFICLFSALPIFKMNKRKKKEQKKNPFLVFI